jgi:predicted O-methyltransferase YrrM
MKEVFEFTPSRVSLFSRFFEDNTYSNLYNQNTGSNWGVYYKWLGCLVRKFNFKNILELGTGTGASAICILSEMSPNSRLTTVDIRRESGEFIVDEMRSDPRFKVVYGNSTDKRNYGDEFPQGMDFVFIDSLHLYRHARPEIDLFIPLCKKGCIVVMDDIHSHDMPKLWNELPYNKLDISDDCHKDAGFGVFEV